MIKQDNAFLNRLINWQGGGGLKLFKKVVLLSALEWKGISNKVTFESNRGIESFIMFERQNMPKMWDRRVTSHFWGDLLHSKRLTPTVTLSPTNIQILLQSRAEVSFEVVLHNGRAGGQTGKVLFTAKPFVSTIFHKRTRFVRAPKLLTDKTSRYPAMHS